MSKILLGMSGGIDSSYAAWLLRRDAHELVGVTLLFHDSPLRAEAIERARACAEALGIEHHVIDMRDTFERCVKEPTAEQFARGCFPNPCTACTRDLKMPALFEQARAFGCDMVATGHYARITHDAEGFELLPYQLRKPLDKAKDQTFLLYGLSQEQLAHLVFPLADIHKGVVRREVMRAGLMRIAPVNDGQGEACFYDGQGHAAWLEGEGGLAPDAGDIVYIGDGRVIGSYDGQYRFAPEQSLGIFALGGHAEDESAPVAEAPAPASEEELFVIHKNVDAHAVYAGSRAVAGTEMCLLRDVRWTSIEAPSAKRSCRARVAYDRKPLPAQVIVQDEGVVVAFSERVGGVRAGQPIVLYSDDLVLGGGIVVG